MLSENLKNRAQILKKKISSTKHAAVLPEYPIKIEPNFNDNQIRQRRPVIFKKIVFDQK